jgi:hypothetical protein
MPAPPHPQIIQDVQTTVVDAAASLEVIQTIGSASFACGPIDIVGAGVIATVVGADASGLLDRHYRRKYYISTNPNPILPQQYHLTNNPFEACGDVHNKGVNLIVQSGGIDIVHNKIIGYDEVTWKNFLRLHPPYSNNTNDLAIGYNCVNQNRLNQSQMDRVRRIQYVRNNEELAALLSANSDIKEYLLSVMNTYTSSKSNNQSNDSIYRFLNSEITKIQLSDKSTNQEKSAVILFLTVLKHSNHFWQ